MRRLSAMCLDGESEDGAQVLLVELGWEGKRGRAGTGCEYNKKRKCREARR